MIVFRGPFYVKRIFYNHKITCIPIKNVFTLFMSFKFFCTTNILYFLIMFGFIKCYIHLNVTFIIWIVKCYIYYNIFIRFQYIFYIEIITCLFPANLKCSCNLLATHNVVSTFYSNSLFIRPWLVRFWVDLKFDLIGQTCLHLFARPNLFFLADHVVPIGSFISKCN